MTSISRASHQPAALCGLSKSLLILFNADLYGYFRSIGMSRGCRQHFPEILHKILSYDFSDSFFVHAPL